MVTGRESDHHRVRNCNPVEKADQNPSVGFQSIPTSELGPGFEVGANSAEKWCYINAHQHVT